MVKASIEKSTEGVARAFDDRDIKSITVIGGLAAVGFVVAASVGGVMAELGPLQLSTMGRAEMAVFAIGAALTAMAGVAFLPSYVGGPLAIGAIVVVGMAMLAAVAGPLVPFDENRFRGVIQTAKVSNPGISASGCLTCGNGAEPIHDDNEGIRTVGDSPVSTGFR